MEKFNYEKNGYNRNEVNSFVKDVINETEAIIKRCKIQAAQIDLLTKELNKYKKLNEVQSDTKQLALKEAEEIIIRAKENANRIVNEALMKAEKLDNTSKELERNIKRLKIRLNSIVEEQKILIEEIELL